MALRVLRAALIGAALSLLPAPRAQAQWSTARLTKSLLYKQELIGAYRDVWGTSPTNVYAAGYGGILHYDGRKWARESVPFPPASLLMRIWGSGTSDIYAIGNPAVFQNVPRPVAFRFDGRRWVDSWPQMALALPTGFSNVNLSRIAGSGRDDVYVSLSGLMNGESYAVLLHFDGSRWSVALLEQRLFIWELLVPRRGELWAVGNTTVLISPRQGATTYAALRHFDGREWRDLSTELNFGPGSDLTTIAALESGDIFLIGGGMFLRGDGARWQRLNTSGKLHARKLLACGSRLCGLVTSDDPAVNLRRGASTALLAWWDNGEWRVIPLNYDTEPEAVWGMNGQLFVVGLGSQLFHFGGKGNIQTPAPFADVEQKQP